jgi:phage tail sheath protein FI
MPEYLSPGVYIEEQATGPEPIEGVSTSVTGFVGVTQRGPVDTLGPVLVTSFPEYQRLFGTYFVPDFPVTPYNFYNFLPHAVAGFFNNGGKLLYIKRVYSSATPPVSATPSTLENNAGAPTMMTRLAKTAATGTLTLQLVSMRGVQNGTQITLTQVKNGVTTVSGALTVASYDDATNTVTLTAALPAPPPPAVNYDSAYTTVALTAGAAFTPAATANKFAIQAADPGAWGNTPIDPKVAGLRVQITPSTQARAQAQVQGIGNVAPGVNNLLLLNSASNFYVGAIIEINTTQEKFYAKVSRVTGSSIQLTANLPAPAVAAINANLPPNPPVATPVRTCEFDVAASYGNVSESFRGLTLDKNTSFFYATTIINGSTLLTVPQTPPPIPSDEATTDPSTMPVAVDGLNVVMAGGTDGAAPTPLDYQGTDLGPGNRTGIQALIEAANISIIAAPGVTDQTTQGALITQCENLKYRFAILDPAPSSSNGTPNMDDIQKQRDQFDTKYAAIYYPRLVVTDPLTDSPLQIPPSGHMAGIYAQTDDSRGVWKAPANVVINGINSLEIRLSKGDQDILNPEPNNINALRDFRAQGRGLRVYGARCITSDEAWKYINVRRLFIFLEASLDQGTQWAVFEPNDQKLWNRLIQSVSSFLTSVWREGGLMGSKPEEAFFVKCGYETMTSDDRENGRLIMLVGVAPVYPAEFVIIRIGQWLGGSSVQEL